MTMREMPQHAGSESCGDANLRSRTATVGMWLFLAALGMLFASSMLGYLLIRLSATSAASRGHIELPAALWVSTAIMLASSFTFHGAMTAVRHERQPALRTYLLVTLLLAVAFIAVQAPALTAVLRSHRAIQFQGLHIYGLVFFLILLHALHVVGGVFALARVSLKARRGVYDHESHAPLRHAAMYWHFLDGVWVVMFGVLLLTS